MNEKAKALGMEHTSFMEPSGLDEAGHGSYDMAPCRHTEPVRAHRFGERWHAR